MHPLTSTLKSFPDFQEVPEEQISNLLEVSKLIEFKEGEFLFEPGKEATDMYIILEGNFKIGLQQKNQFRTVAELNRGSISGILPFSRMKAATGMSYATTDSKVVCIGKKYFKQIVGENYELTQALVQHMTSRVRSFTTMRQQNEKMMALGKMSAGLAHELNNPAAAIIRSSEALKEHLGMVPERFKQVLDISTTPEIVDQVNEILADRISDSTSCRLSLMERTDMEDEIAEYLEDLGVDDGFEMAETFVEFHFEVDHLKSIASLLEDKDTIPVLRWVESNLITEKMVNEINEAADRISKLVNSVKAYSHMDRAPEKTKASIHHGIENTLSLLNHKVKKGNIELKLNFDESIEPVGIFVSEMNQVWTNLIDNAIDAMENSDSKVLEIASSQNKSEVEIRIIDSGSGIEEDVLNKIFDPFFTTKDVGKGTGLGLDTSLKIVQKHNGEIKVNSETGRTEFLVKLPKDI